jgi:hypothetical protein
VGKIGLIAIFSAVGGLEELNNGDRVFWEHQIFLLII